MAIEDEEYSVEWGRGGKEVGDGGCEKDGN